MTIITYADRTSEDAFAIAERIVELGFVARVGCAERFMTSVVVDDADVNALIDDVHVATSARPTSVA